MALLTTSGIVRVGTDPTLKFLPSGMAVTDFRAVASRNKKKDDGSWETSHEMWFTVTCFNALAEHAAEHVTKGDQAYLFGEIYEEEWTTQEGETRKTLKVIANAVQPIPKRPQQQQQWQGQQPPQQQWPQQSQQAPQQGQSQWGQRHEQQQQAPQQFDDQPPFR